MEENLFVSKSAEGRQDMTARGRHVSSNRNQGSKDNAETGNWKRDKVLDSQRTPPVTSFLQQVSTHKMLHNGTNRTTNWRCKSSDT